MVERLIPENAVLFVCLGIFVVTHSMIVLAAFALWVRRVTTKTWDHVTVFNSDWDTAQKGLAGHSISTVVLWLYLLFCQIAGWTVETHGESVLGIMIIILMCSMFSTGGLLCCGSSTREQFPGHERLSVFGSLTVFGWIGSIFIAALLESLAQRYIIIQAFVVLCCIIPPISFLMCLLIVFRHSLMEHKVMYQTGENTCLSYKRYDSALQEDNPGTFQCRDFYELKNDDNLFISSHIKCETHNF